MASFDFSDQQSRQRAFWAWFASHADGLREVADGDDPRFHALASALKEVHPDLTFELGPRGTPRQLVLSADGLRAAFPEVEALHAAAPSLPEWRVIKFRPRRSPLGVLTIGDATFDPERMRFLLVRDEPGKVGIVLFLDGQAADENSSARAGYLMLDEAIGEYDMETRVGAIDFAGRDSKYFAQARPLAELAQAFDDHFAATRPR